MAKQAVGTIERHAEKGVLGLCGLLLVAAIALYLVSSPSRVEIGGEAVEPSQVDTALADAAERLRHAKSPVDSKPPQDPVADMKTWLTNLILAAKLSPQLPSPLPPLPSVPDIYEGPGQGPSRLVVFPKFLPPKSLQIHTGRTVASVPPAASLSDGASTGGSPAYGAGGGQVGGEGDRAEFNWVTVSGLYNRAEQEKLCLGAGYGDGRRDHYVAGVDLQRRERRPDGSYTEWQDVKTYAPVYAPAPEPIQVIKSGGGKPTVSSENLEYVTWYTDLIRYPLNQLALMRPLFPVPLAGDYWKLPEYPGILIEALDAEYMVAGGPTGSTPDRSRYAALIEDAGTKADATGNTNDRDIAALKERFAKGSSSLAELENQRSTGQELQGRPDLTVKQENEVKRILKEINAAMDKLHTAPPKPPAPGPGPDPSRTAPPRAPAQIVWAHDALRDSVVSGRTYQYRMRLRLFNRYCAFPGDLKDPADAEKILVVSDWSDTSADVTVKPDSAFFLTSAAANNDVRAEVFKWVEGEWVKQTFTLEVGKPIGALKRVTLPSDPKKPARPVNFDTGAVLVAVDPSAPYRPVKKTPDGGLELKSSKNSLAIVYADSAGQLCRRILDADKDSEQLKEFRALVKRPPPVRRETDTSTPTGTPTGTEPPPMGPVSPPAGHPGRARPPRERG